MLERSQEKSIGKVSVSVVTTSYTTRYIGGGIITYLVQLTPLIKDSDITCLGIHRNNFCHLCVFYVENSSDMTNFCYNELSFWNLRFVIRGVD